MLHYVLYSIKRRKTANLITAGISVMLVILLNLYFGSLGSYQRQLRDLAQNVPIYCQITNLNGTLGNGLFIPKRIVDGLMESGQVKDLSYMMVMMAGEGDFEEEEYYRHLNLYVVGANKAEAAGELTNDMISMDSQAVEDFFASDSMECVVSESVMRRSGWEIGDRIILKCYYYDAASEYTKMEIHPMDGVVEVEIAGTMDVAGKTNAIDMDVILPVKAAEHIFEQAGLPFFADMVTFHVKDPLNLDLFKARMQELGLMEIKRDAMNSYTGSALAVRDADFIARATDLRHSIELLQSFLPVVCILVLTIGYVVSYLSGNSRREEFALFRLQGMRKMRAAGVFLLEQMILVLAGNLIGDAVMALTAPKLSTMFLVNGVLFTAYLIGAAAAYGRMSRGSVMYLLSVQQ